MINLQIKQLNPNKKTYILKFYCKCLKNKKSFFLLYRKILIFQKNEFQFVFYYIFDNYFFSLISIKLVILYCLLLLNF